MSLTFVSLWDIPSDNSSLNAEMLQSFSLFSQYYREYYGDNYRDLSFTIFHKNELIGYVICAVLNNSMTIPNGGIDIILIDSLSIKEKKRIYTDILDFLISSAKNFDASSITIKDSLLNGSLSVLGEILFNQRFESRLTFEMAISFSGFSEEKFRSSLRKSYKSLISWGKRELKTDFVNKESLDRNRFDEFHAFHCRISGRKTRSQETWDMQYNMIQEGLAELITATYNGQLAAGSLFCDYGNTSTYFTGVYERSLFEYGISHYLLYEGILRSYIRHQTDQFSLGYFDTDIKDAKWYNIQFFKKGFCKSLTPIILWHKTL